MAMDIAQQRTTSQIAIFIYSFRLHQLTFRFWAIDLKTKPRVLYKMSRIARANVGRGLASKAFLRYFAAVK